MRLSGHDKVNAIKAFADIEIRVCNRFLEKKVEKNP